MEIVFLTIVVFLGFFALAAVGVIFGQKPIKGSCGGINCHCGKKACDTNA